MSGKMLNNIGEIVQLEDEIRQLEMELESRYPQKRRIVCAYANAEFERLDEAVYSLLEKEHPSLSGLLEKRRKENDPIQEREEITSQIQKLRVVQKLIDSRSVGNEETQTVKAMLDSFSPFIEFFIELYEQFVPIQEQFYIELTSAVKRVSFQNGVGIEETVRNLQYMDKVSRWIIPTREGAESFLRTIQAYEKNAINMARGFVAFVKYVGKAGEDLLEAAKLIPTVAAIEAFQKGTWEYKMQEFDRVYSV